MSHEAPLPTHARHGAALRLPPGELLPLHGPQLRAWRALRLPGVRAQPPGVPVQPPGVRAQPLAVRAQLRDVIRVADWWLDPQSASHPGRDVAPSLTHCYTA